MKKRSSKINNENCTFKNITKNKPKKPKQKKKEKSKKESDTKLLNKKTKRPKENMEKKINIKINKEENSCKTIDLNINMKEVNQEYILTKTLIKDQIMDSIVFKSLNSIFYFIYIKYECKTIFCYNLSNEQFFFVIKDAHPDYIKNIKYIFDKKHKRDLIMTISTQKIKIWNAINFQCLTDINKKYNDIYKICDISYLSNNNYINFIESSNEVPILIYDFEGKIIKEIKNEETIYELETFFDDKSSKSYIILNNDSYLKSYDYDNDKEYIYYFHDTYNTLFYILINNKKDETQLIGVGHNYPFIIIWNFHTGEKLYDIYLKGNVKSAFDTFYISYPFLWDEQNLCFGISNDVFKGRPGVYSLKILNLKNLNVCNNLINYKDKRFSMVERIQHPIYKECLIIEIYLNEISLWKKKKN